MGLMDSKRGLVVGIANDHSYAYFIAEALIRHGAECLFTHLPGDRMQRRCARAIKQLGIDDPWLEPLDAGSDDQLDRVFAQIGGDFGRIDFLVHSIAYADREWLKDGAFAGTPREVFSQALDISAYTYMAMAHRAAPLMASGEGTSGENSGGGGGGGGRGVSCARRDAQRARWGPAPGGSYAAQSLLPTLAADLERLRGPALRGVGPRA
ncbi:MAG: SDR family oxidoreductase [Planctomycetes bacterium]|nr:SDR family oxidoreductase [Planctomycetota bacterium]